MYGCLFDNKIIIMIITLFRNCKTDKHIEEDELDFVHWKIA
jgi:hypothetical protein